MDAYTVFTYVRAFVPSLGGCLGTRLGLEGGSNGVHEGLSVEVLIRRYLQAVQSSTQQSIGSTMRYLAWHTPRNAQTHGPRPSE